MKSEEIEGEIEALQEKINDLYEKYYEARDAEIKERLSNIEPEFRDAVKKHRQPILDLLKEAEDKLWQACDLANKHGIPFYSDVSPLGQKYIPSTFFSEKLSKLDEIVQHELLGFAIDNRGCEGWQVSRLGC